MGLHSKSGAIDWDEARRQGDVPGRAGAMRVDVLRSVAVEFSQPEPDYLDMDAARRIAERTADPCEASRSEPDQLPLLDTTAPPAKRGLDPRNPDDEAWDEAYYGAHSDGGD